MALTCIYLHIVFTLLITQPRPMVSVTILLSCSLSGPHFFQVPTAVTVPAEPHALYLRYEYKALKIDLQKRKDQIVLLLGIPSKELVITIFNTGII